MANNSRTIPQFGGLVCVVIASVSALAAYNFSEKFNHNILLDITTFIISFVALVLVYGLVSKFLTGVINDLNGTADGKTAAPALAVTVVSAASEGLVQPTESDSTRPDLIRSSLDKYEDMLAEAQRKDAQRRLDTLQAIHDYVMRKLADRLSKKSLAALLANIERLAFNTSDEYEPLRSDMEKKLKSPDLRHLSWNIGERLGIPHRERAVFIKASFSVELQNASIEYLEANLRDTVPSYIRIDVPDEGDYRFHDEAETELKIAV